MSKLVAAELGNVPEIDLHGMTVDQAIRETEDFLYKEQNSCTQAVRIICGRGSGSLQRELTRWLIKSKQNRSLVEDYMQSNQPHQQGGVILVSLVSLR